MIRRYWEGIGHSIDAFYFILFLFHHIFHLWSLVRSIDLMLPFDFAIDTSKWLNDLMFFTIHVLFHRQQSSSSSSRKSYESLPGEKTHMEISSRDLDLTHFAKSCGL